MTSPAPVAVGQDRLLRLQLGFACYGEMDVAAVEAMACWR